MALGPLGTALTSSWATIGQSHRVWAAVSLAIAREIKDRVWGRCGTGDLGHVAYRSLADLAKAIEYGQQQLAIARDLKDRPGEGSGSGHFGVAYQSSWATTAKAIEYGQQTVSDRPRP